MTIEPMTLLQEQVAELGVCPTCHTKTLEPVFNDGLKRFYDWRRCSQCKWAWLLDGTRINPTMNNPEQP